MADAIERLEEYVSNVGVVPKVDRDKGVIYGVKIVGIQSSNPGRRHYSYPPATLAKAVPLYEGAIANVDHHKPGENVPYRDRIGIHRNVQARADGLYSDFHFNPKHALAEQLCWDAENAPSKVGFSHLADGRVNRSKQEAPVVEEITVVESVDLVSNPATNRGIFESVDVLPDDPAQRELCEHGLSVCSDARTIMLGAEPIETKKSRISEVLARWSAELSPKEPSKERNVEYADLTVASLKEHRSDLVEVLTGTDAISKLNTQVKNLTETVAARDVSLKEASDKLAAIEVEKAKQSAQAAIAGELKAAGINVADKRVCTDAIMSQLSEAKDSAARKPLVELMAMAQKTSPPKGCETPGAPPFAPVGGGAGDGTPARSKRELLERL